MREIDRVLEQLQRAYDGDAWFGSSVRAALEGVDAKMATTGALESTHTIAEIVLHVTSWTREVARRLRTGIALDPDEGDWPRLAINTEADWAAALERLYAAQADLLNAVAALDDARLDERIGSEPKLGEAAQRGPLDAADGRYLLQGSRSGRRQQQRQGHDAVDARADG